MEVSRNGLEVWIRVWRWFGSHGKVGRREQRACQKLDQGGTTEVARGRIGRSLVEGETVVRRTTQI